MKINIPILKEIALDVFLFKKESDNREFIKFVQTPDSREFAIEKIVFDKQRLQVVLINGNAVGSDEWENNKNQRIYIDDNIILDSNLSDTENVYRHIALSVLRFKVLSDKYYNFKDISNIYEMINDESMDESTALETAYNCQKLRRYFDDIITRKNSEQILELYNKNIWTLENMVEKLGIKKGDVFEDKETKYQRMIIGFTETKDKNGKLILSSRHLDLNRPSTLYFSARENTPKIDNNDWLKFDSNSYLNKNNYAYKGNIQKQDIVFNIIKTQASIQQAIWVLDNFSPKLLEAYENMILNNDSNNFQNIIRDISNKKQLISHKYDGVAIEKLHKDLSSDANITIVQDFEAFKSNYFAINEDKKNDVLVKNIFNKIEQNLNDLNILIDEFEGNLLSNANDSYELNNLIKKYEEKNSNEDGNCLIDIKNNKPQKKR